MKNSIKIKMVQKCPKLSTLFMDDPLGNVCFQMISQLKKKSFVARASLQLKSDLTMKNSIKARDVVQQKSRSPWLKSPRD